jgi:hypothetical protein
MIFTREYMQYTAESTFCFVVDGAGKPIFLLRQGLQKTVLQTQGHRALTVAEQMQSCGHLKQSSSRPEIIDQNGIY